MCLLFIFGITAWAGRNLCGECVASRGSCLRAGTCSTDGPHGVTACLFAPKGREASAVCLLENLPDGRTFLRLHVKQACCFLR